MNMQGNLASVVREQSLYYFIPQKLEVDSRDVPEVGAHDGYLAEVKPAALDLEAAQLVTDLKGTTQCKINIELYQH